MLLHPEKGDPAGLLAEGPYGARVPVLDGALVLAEGGGEVVEFSPAVTPVALELGMIRAMRVLAVGCGINDRRYIMTVGSLCWDNADQFSASLRVVVDGKERWMTGHRAGWKLSAHTVESAIPRNYWCQYFMEPWGDEKSGRKNNEGKKLMPAEHRVEMVRRAMSGIVVEHATRVRLNATGAYLLEASGGAT